MISKIRQKISKTRQKDLFTRHMDQTGLPIISQTRHYAEGNMRQAKEKPMPSGTGRNTPEKGGSYRMRNTPFRIFWGGRGEIRPSAGRTSPQRTGGDRPNSARKAPPGSRRSPCTRQGSSGALPYRGRRGGTEYDAVCVDSGLRGSLQERAAFRAETGAGVRKRQSGVMSIHGRIS